MEIKILGSGCKKCQNLELKVREVVSLNNIAANIVKVTDFEEIMQYKIMMTPGLVINNKVVSTGILPDSQQILTWIKEAIV